MIYRFANSRMKAGQSQHNMLVSMIGPFVIWWLQVTGLKRVSNKTKWVCTSEWYREKLLSDLEKKWPVLLLYSTLHKFHINITHLFNDIPTCINTNYAMQPCPRKALNKLRAVICSPVINTNLTVWGEREQESGSVIRKWTEMQDCAGMEPSASVYAKKTCQVKMKDGWRKDTEIDRHRIKTLWLNALVYRVMMH